MSIRDSQVFMTVQVNGKDEQQFDKDSMIKQISNFVQMADKHNAADVSTIFIRLSRQQLKSSMPQLSDEDKIMQSLTEHAMSESEFRATMDPEQLAYFDATQSYGNDPMFKSFITNCREKNRHYLTSGEWDHIMQYAMTHFPIAYDRMRPTFNGPPRLDSVI
jgi:hypothetical protein